MQKNKSAIVTGGAGFIGSHLTRRLLDEGWDVLVIDNLSSGRRSNVPEKARFLWLDLGRDDAILEMPAEPVDVVFHLASHVGQELSFERPLYDLKANGLSTMTLLNWCLQKKVKQLIFASSMNVYGEPDSLPVSESAAIKPPSPYAVGKISSEYLCAIYQNFGVNTTCLRLFNVYGPLQDMQNLMQGMVSIYMAYVAKNQPLFIRGSLERFRDFVFVADVVDAFMRCMNEKAYGKIYNISTGRQTYVRELLQAIIKAWGRDMAEYPITYGDPTRRDQFGIYGDSSLIRSDLGWNPSVTLEKGIEIMSGWVKEELVKNGF
ncbi:NAD-dependent epimerase/dehydratase family protein [bacterium]|nr:NAD-dependent epimerase/dehydratase family protein [bacterium]